jgi:rRNA-processing protein FCF1
MKILLDTNFILSCVKQKIDFFSITEEVINEKIEWIIPKQVSDEILKLSKKAESPEDRRAAKLSEIILKYNQFEVIDVKNSKDVDEGIRQFLKDKPEIVIATLDRGLKNSIKNKVLTIKGNDYLELI